MLQIRRTGDHCNIHRLPLRNPNSGVQVALTTFGVTRPADADTLYSLGGIFDAAIFIFYRNTEPVTVFSRLRGKRISIGISGTARN
jgi:hypothetical protein